MLVFSTSERQLIKMSISVDRPNDDVSYEYLVYPFHSRAIEGMDVCVKKQLVATCSSDRTVKIWSYTLGANCEFKLEINQVFENDEAKSLAFHPSGFHLVVGFTDKLKMLNIFQNRLEAYKEISIKNCNEIVFSHGGHLFAC